MTNGFEKHIDFCLIPIGTPSASVSSEVAAVQRLLKSSGVEYTMHSAGTTLGIVPPYYQILFSLPLALDRSC